MKQKYRLWNEGGCVAWSCQAFAACFVNCRLKIIILTNTSHGRGDQATLCSPLAAYTMLPWPFLQTSLLRNGVPEVCLYPAAFFHLSLESHMEAQ